MLYLFHNNDMLCHIIPCPMISHHTVSYPTLMSPYFGCCWSFRRVTIIPLNKITGNTLRPNQLSRAASIAGHMNGTATCAVELVRRGLQAATRYNTRRTLRQSFAIFFLVLLLAWRALYPIVPYNTRI